MDFKAFPIFINSYNRLECLERLVEALVQRGYWNVTIVDNGSTYPALLDKLDTLPVHQVIRLDQNYGHYAIWDAKILERCELKDRWYAYTDPDIIPTAECPADFMELLYRALERFPEFPKAGLGLRIDDLPDHYARRQDVLSWEGPNWLGVLNPGEEVALYDAGIDTTFALYRPGAGYHSRAIRSGHPYVARHDPWYQDSQQPGLEELQYRRTAKPGECSWNEGRNIR